MGEDVGLHAADLDAALALRTLARRGSDEACLLPRRLATLDLDPDDFARLEPSVFCELHRRCTMCDSKGECALDLAGDVVHPAWRNRAYDWHDYCPNASTLTAFAESPGLRRTREPERYFGVKDPDPAEQLRQRLEALSISMRP